MSEFGEYLEPKHLVRPSVSEIIQGLLVSGDAYTSDFEILKAHLDRIAPVHAWFKVLSTPQGYEPGEMREQWVGLTLPIRAHRDKGITIIAREALEKLRSKNPVAHQWWVNHYIEEFAAQVPEVDPHDHPDSLTNIISIVLEDACGESRLEE